MASINIIARDNGVGLSRDLQVLSARLSAGGFEVAVTAIHGGKITKWLRPPMKRLQWRLAKRTRRSRAAGFDINLMLEHIWPDDLPFARHNVLVPNPEWFLPRDLRHLDAIDLVLAKTRHAERIFRELGRCVVYTGFTSRDPHAPFQSRQASFFHLAGRSHAKGTERLLALWRRHPEWPLLTVVQNPRCARPGPPAANIDHRIGYLADDELERLQNRHRFHLCPSETEGFGHYIAEALAVGALTLTVDAAPMNELVTPERGILVPARPGERRNLSRTHYFDETALEQAIGRILALDPAQLHRYAQSARAWHAANDHAFSMRLVRALRTLLGQHVEPMQAQPLRRPLPVALPEASSARSGRRHAM